MRLARRQVLDSPWGGVSLEHQATHTLIQAADPLAADWALGWWHGHEAGDEAILTRAFWRAQVGSAGRPSAAKTEVDTFLGRWGFTAALEKETGFLPAGDRARVQAYVQGFNHGRRRRSGELPWSPEDCHLLVRSLGFLEWWETRAPQIAYLLEAWQGGLSWERVLDLWPGLGPEPPPEAWKGLTLPSPFSPEAWVLVQQLRRLRPGRVEAVPGAQMADGKAVLAASYVSDVTDPGLPFLPVRIVTSAGTLAGLSRPGHPGFLAGQSAHLAWQAVPVVDDIVDHRILDGNSTRTLSGFWAGADRTGTLESLLFLETALTAPAARDKTLGTGSACLDVTAVDVQGAALSWSLGARWTRPQPRDAWLPGPWGSESPAGPRTQGAVSSAPKPGRPTAETLAQGLARTQSDLPDDLLPTLRFLLPDTDEGLALRRWNGSPGAGREAAAFERLAASVFETFWEASPLSPPVDSPVHQALLAQTIRLVQAPHSAWFPSSEKNRRLADAVRRAFVPGRPPAPPLLGRRASKPCWTETNGGRTRIWAATVAFVAVPGAPTWKVFLTDDETQPAEFLPW